MLALDHYIFKFINISLSNPVFDAIMPIFDKTKFLLPFLLLPWIVVAIKDKPNRVKLLVLIPLAILFVDQTGLFIKKLVDRPRPWAFFDLNTINHLVSQKGKYYSFPSNHAANISALALIFSSIYSKYMYGFWVIAITVMFSRIYIGVHFPSDILAGWCIGCLYGAILIKGWAYFAKKRLPHSWWSNF